MIERLKAIREGRAENCILPFFWMKGEEHSVILEEIEKVEECGIKEICLESRPHPQFCEEGWWKDLDFIMAEAKKRGMRVWVLDDKKFPTGYANGAFEKKHPELSKLYLAQRHVDIMGPCRGGASLVGNFLSPDGELIAILACPKPDGETLAVSGDGILDLTANYKDGFVFYDLPEGAYRLFVLFTTRKGGGREHYMNLIDSESVRVLIDEVYETHYERYKDEFGKTFAGFFSDEPEIGNVPGYPFDCLPGQPDIRLPWSRELEEKLRALWGEDFQRNLPALWYESGEKTGTVRGQFMDCVTRLVYECFSGQIGDWCAAHNVEYIGHIIEDDNAHDRLGCSIGHYFREMKGQHMAGIDVVHHQIVPGFTEKIHQWIAGDADGEFFHFGLAKLGSSAAHLDPEKRGRALCECFGNYGWAEGVSLMKWLTNHMLVRGINRFTPHAFAMSYPDPDCPPHFYAGGNNPQFWVFACLMKYMNRAAYLLSAGSPVRDAAVLYHAESEWSKESAGESVMYFQKPMRVLMEHQMDADVVPDDAFACAEAVRGRLKIGTESYPALIIPGCERIGVHAAAFVERLSASGEDELPVFIVGQIPKKDMNGRALSEAFYSRVRAVSLEELADAVRGTAGGSAKAAQREGAGETAVGDTAAGDTAASFWTADRYVPELRSFAVSAENALIAMFFNESTQKRAEVQMKLSRGAYRKVTIADLWNEKDETYRIGKNCLPVSLEPGEAVFMILEESEESDKESDKEPDEEPDEKLQERSERNELPAIPVKIAELPIGQEWKVSRRRRTENEFEPVLTIRQGEEYPNMNGPERDIGFVGTYRYETEVELDLISASGSAAGLAGTERRCKIRIPYAGDTAQIFLNGENMGYMANFPGRVDVTDRIVNGTNRICIDVTTTLVWERKDGASTHLQIMPTGLSEAPILEIYEGGEQE